MTSPRLTDRTGKTTVSPGRPWTSFTTVYKYELLMTTRSRIAWLAITPLLLVALLAALTSEDVIGDGSAATRVGSCAVLISVFVSVGVGVAMTDRLVRLHGLGLDELMLALPCRPLVRFVGGFLGNISALLAPSAVALILIGGFVAVTSRDPRALPSAALAFLVIVAPAAGLISMASALAGMLLPIPLARALTVIAWFWATLFNQSMIPLPTPTGTVFSPLGDYAAAAWWNVTPLWAGRGQPPMLSPDPNPSTAIINVAVVVAVTVALGATAYGLSVWRTHSPKSA